MLQKIKDLYAEKPKMVIGVSIGVVVAIVTTVVLIVKKKKGSNKTRV